MCLHNCRIKQNTFRLTHKPKISLLLSFVLNRLVLMPSHPLVAKSMQHERKSFLPRPVRSKYLNMNDGKPLASPRLGAARIQDISCRGIPTDGGGYSCVAHCNTLTTHSALSSTLAYTCAPKVDGWVLLQSKIRGG